jgi:hypothetical protein
MSVPGKSWIVRPFCNGDETLVENLYFETQGKFDQNKWKRNFKLLPASPEGMFYHLAIEGNKCIGQYAVQPHYFSYRGNKIVGAHSLATLTHPSYRKQGIFFTLATAVYSQLRRANIVFVVGFPNSYSAPGFLNKLGWVRIRPGFHLICPLGIPSNDRVNVPKNLIRISDNLFRLSRRFTAASYHALSRSLRSRVSITEVVDIPFDIDVLWKSISSTATLARWRDREYMSWRYTHGGGYSMYEARDKIGDLVGFAVLGPSHKQKYNLASVLELMVKPKEKWVVIELLERLKHAASKSGVDFLQVFCAMSRWEFPWHLAAGFVWIPDKYFGHSAVKAACHIGPGEPAADVLYDSANWFVSFGDQDNV